MRKKLCSAALTLVFMLTGSSAFAEDKDDWFGPGEGVLEIRTTLDMTHLFNSERTQFTLQAGLGYFFVDWLEGGLTVSFGYTGSIKIDNPAPMPLTDGGEIGHDVKSLAVGPVNTGGGVFGGTGAFLRFFPFILLAREALPEWFSPFVNLDFGALYQEKINPFLAVGLSIGANFYLTNQIALSPEIGYTLLYATDDDVRFGSKRLEHVIGVNWALSFFF